MKSNFSLDDLQLFQQVVRHAGISAAARATGIPSATLSRRLKQLEQALGGRLLERNAHHFALTELGEGYYQRCTPLLAELQAIGQQLNEAHTRLSGQLRITAPVGITHGWLGRCFSDFLLRYPGIELELVLSNQLENLVEQHIDAAFRVGELRDSSWVARKIWEARVQLCASKGYLRKAGTPTHPEQLHQHALIASYPLHEWWLEQINSGENYRMRPQTRLRVNDVSVAMSAAEAGVGITLLPAYFLAQHPKLQPVLADWQGIRRPLYVYYRDREVIPARLKTLIDFVLEWLSAEGTPARLLVK